MTPKQILLEAFERQVTPWLQERGFRFGRYQFCYKRTKGEFTQQITIFLHLRNSAENMDFQSIFTVLSPKYNRWLCAHGRPGSDGVIAGCMDSNIPGWSSDDDFQVWIDFTDPATRYAVIEEWKRRVEAAGLAFLERLSSWSGAAEALLFNGDDYEKAADFFLMASNAAAAIAALREGIRTLEAQDLRWSEQCHPVLVAKRKQQIVERDNQIALFLQRIHRLETREQNARLTGASEAPSEYPL